MTPKLLAAQIRERTKSRNADGLRQNLDKLTDDQVIHAAVPICDCCCQPLVTQDQVAICISKAESADDFDELITFAETLNNLRDDDRDDDDREDERDERLEAELQEAMRIYAANQQEIFRRASKGKVLDARVIRQQLISRGAPKLGTELLVRNFVLSYEARGIEVVPSPPISDLHFGLLQ
jgi:hypothetical protein